MTAPAPVTAPRGRRRWGLLVVALLGMVLIPQLAAIIVPVTRSLLLVLPALGALMLAGWVVGGSVALAVAWGGVAVLAVVWPPPSGGFDLLQRGWAVALSALFGLIVLVRARGGSDVRFLTPALLAVGAAVGGAATLALLTHGAPERVASLLQGEYGDRIAKPVEVWEAYFASSEWTETAAKSPAMAQMGTDFLAQLRALPAIALAYARVGPAMLALESLAALALAWALYHRLGRRPLGPAFGAFRDFRFSDHLVWGLALGITLLVLPDLRGATPVGLNLLVFFGALYALRGLGVLAWFFKPGRMATVLIVLASLLALPVALPALLAVALGLGVGDTWLDWRSRARPSPKTSE